MEIKNYLDLKLIGLIGALLLIISEFLPWFSEYSLLEIYSFYALSSGTIGNAFRVGGDPTKGFSGLRLLGGGLGAAATTYQSV